MSEAWFPNALRRGGYDPDVPRPPRGDGDSREADRGDELGEAEVVSEGGRVRGDTPRLQSGANAAAPDSAPTWPSRGRSRSRRRVRETDASGRLRLSAEQRLLILDTWIRSKLPAAEFGAMVGVSSHTLFKWKQRFREDGPAGLVDRPKPSQTGSRLPEPTKRAILMLKEAHPDWGEERIHDVLMRTEGYGASPGAIGRVLAEAGWEVADVPTKPHAPKVTRFEREKPNELWQTDLFTFVLKREGRRVHAVVFLDDSSRFVVGHGLHASASGALVREVFEAAIANFGAPAEVLTDNGTQYHTWRGKSEFHKLCERRGIRQIVASPRRPQTLGKIERFWGSLWRECVQEAIFRGLDDARRRIALFIDHYNFQRPHQGIGGLVPADRFFAAAPQVLETLRNRVQTNALELARNGEPRKPFYLTGRVGGQSISLHAEGEKVVLTRESGEREEVDLGAPGKRAEETDGLPDAVSATSAPPDHEAELRAEDLAPPGTSSLDGDLERLREGLDGDSGAKDEAGDDEPVFGGGL